MWYAISMTEEQLTKAFELRDSLFEIDLFLLDVIPDSDELRPALLATATVGQVLQDLVIDKMKDKLGITE